VVLILGFYGWRSIQQAISLKAQDIGTPNPIQLSRAAASDEPRGTDQNSLPKNLLVFR
jgi:hypothetical protein